MRPVRIIGGGIAGLCLGIALRRDGVPVEVFEAGSYPRHRVCGEFLAGSPRAAEALGISDLLSDALLHRTTSWYAGARLVLQRELPEPARAISRHALDERLADRLRTLGGIVWEQQRREPSGKPGEVVASGRIRQEAGRWLGLKAHYRGVACTAGLEMHLGAQSYVGLTPLPDGWVNVCGLFPAGASASGGGRERLLPRMMERAGLPDLARRLEAAELRPGSVCGVSAFAFGPTRETAAVGDAWGMIPPFTGNGMTLAMEMAADAAPILLTYARGQRPWPDTLSALQTALRLGYRRRLQRAQAGQWLLERLARWPLVTRLPVQQVFPFRWLYASLH